jgi:hypothetical protein
MKKDKILSIDKKLSELLENIMMTKAQFNNNTILNLFESEDIINDESNLLASYAYELERLTLKRVLLKKGYEEIADDFDKSASFSKHKDNIINENTSIIQSNCKPFGEHIDIVFNKIRDNFHEYLKFLVEDAAGPKTFVKQAKAAQ